MKKYTRVKYKTINNELVTTEKFVSGTSNMILQGHIDLETLNVSFLDQVSGSTIHVAEHFARNLNEAKRVLKQELKNRGVSFDDEVRKVNKKLLDAALQNEKADVSNETETEGTSHAV